MDGSAESYAGDAAMTALLRAERAPLDAAGLRALIAGSLAAPEPADPDDWFELVRPGIDPKGALAHQLRALRTRMASERSPYPDEEPPDLDRADRLAALRGALDERGLDGFLVPRADEHQGEYVPPSASRLGWLTGFTGSAGLALVLTDQASLFVDGRYTLQAEHEVDTAAFTIRHLYEKPVSEFLAETLEPGQRLGFDPWLHSVNGATALEKACRRAGAELVACDDNPLDAVWRDRPPPPLSPMRPHPLDYAGESSGQKRARVAETIAVQGADAAVLAAPDSIAWLLNVRGGDLPHTPFSLAFAIVDAAGAVDLFVDTRKLIAGIRAHFGPDVSLRAPKELGPALDALGMVSDVGGSRAGRVMLDPAATPSWIARRLDLAGVERLEEMDPVALPKARKNRVELAGMRAAHTRDGVALCRFLHWLSKHGASGKVTELDVSERLWAFRREVSGDQPAGVRDMSFQTISGYGPNGAIVHYRVTRDTDRTLEAGSLYLVDSGGQYPDGTTDVTRTMALGAPNAEMRERYTLVLKGHVAIALAVFPEGTSGSQLDVLARQALWRHGLDYDHGTGHGVGSYLSVHEGPQRISKSPAAVALEPGMVVSNEPGYYKADAYGIRIENLVAVEQRAVPGGERAMLGFETLTLAPLDRTLIDTEVLTGEEIAWVDHYHARVLAEIGPLCDRATTAWLKKACAPLL